IGLSWRRGLTLGELGDPAGAAAEARRALGLFGESPSRTGRDVEFGTAAVTRRGRAWPGGRERRAPTPRGGPPAGGREKRWGARGTGVTKKRNTGGRGRPGARRPWRDDFRLLRGDLPSPAEPFARGR